MLSVCTTDVQVPMKTYLFSEGGCYDSEHMGGSSLYEKCLDMNSEETVSCMLPVLLDLNPSRRQASGLDLMAEFHRDPPYVQSTLTSKQPMFKTDPDFNVDEWKEKNIKDWTHNDVLQWIASVAESRDIPCELINAKAFNVDGATLVKFTSHDFCVRDEHYGNTLYEALTQLQSSHSSNSNHGESPPSTISSSFETLTKPTRELSFSLQNYVGYTNDSASSLDSYPFKLDISPSEHKREEATTEPEEPVSANNIDTPSSSDSESDSEKKQVKEKKLSKPSSTNKRPPGRPPGVKSKKEKPEKTGRLWEFIRDLLLNPHHCPSLICWENHDEGLFRFVKSEKVAKIWGDRKGNDKMTYEKLSRAMRYYYKSKIFLPVEGRRLVYKFGPTARGWRTDNPNFKNKDT